MHLTFVTLQIAKIKKNILVLDFTQYLASCSCRVARDLFIIIRVSSEEPIDRKEMSEFNEFVTFATVRTTGNRYIAAYFATLKKLGFHVVSVTEC